MCIAGRISAVQWRIYIFCSRGYILHWRISAEDIYFRGGCILQW
jgi:hypothetical protein